jgi:DNA-binding LytR/AlgR family response regulator
VLFHALGVSRFGFTPHQTRPDQSRELPSEVADPAMPEFLRRAPGARAEDLIALSAQDHYLEVRHAKGTALIHYALSDAIGQLERAGIAGFRIHRSHWVARAAVAMVESEGRHYVLRLTDQTRLPIGPTYVELLRSAGLLPARRGSVAVAV